MAPVTSDVIALCGAEPGAEAVAAALEAAGRGLGIRGVEHGGLVQLCDGNGRALVTVEGPLLVQVAGEARRILGPGIEAPCPAWWIEARADRHSPEAGEIAQRFAGQLVAATGGCTWTGRAARPGGGPAADAAG
jgi:hypothetical protein